MKKFKHFVIGGIQHKVFNLVLCTILLMFAAYTAVIVYQARHLTALVNDTNDAQKQSISEISQETMREVLDSSLVQNTQMQAYIARDLFDDAAGVVNNIADYAEKLFADPDAYPARTAAPPDPALDGQISVQLLTGEGVDLSDPVIAEKLGLIGNLSELMTALYANAKVDSCYAALPEGVMLLVDDHAGSKFDELGAPVFISVQERPWYTGAVEKGGICFTDVTTDVFTGNISVMCSTPVYQNGRLAAVIGADLFLNDMAAAVDQASQNGASIVLVNENGHVVISSRKTGLFQVQPSDRAEDLRESDNGDLAAFVRQALRETTALRLIEADGELCYVTGAPIDNVGWTILCVVPKVLADAPTLAMEQQHDAIREAAVDRFREEISHAKSTICTLLSVAVVLGLASALILAKRIVKPLNTITRRVQHLGGSNLLFTMEKEYRTGDEIEVLAESFAMLSGKTLRYIDEVERVTAEKERIGAELSLATRIQADMLPNIFPPFPERTEFDIYASMDPAREVGGDFYDFFLVDEDHLCVVMADVSGKGVPAALFMMASKIVLKNHAMLGKSPAQILTDTNTAICANNREQMFVTVWLGILELSTGRLTAANAGHEYPAIRRQNGRYELYKDRHGFVIGGMEGMKYKEYQLMLEPGARLFVYTDGVPEAANALQELFGTERMLSALNAAPDAAAADVLKNVRASVDDFVKDAEQFDDLTMLCLEYKGKDKKL